MPLTIIQGDITRQPVDAVVNAANSRLAPGGGVCGAIFAAAGYDKLNQACRGLEGCETGNAVLTDGFDLPAKYIIHAVGPVWQGGGQQEAKLLESCYTNALGIAADHGCHSVAFPVISAGIYGYPKREALRIAVRAIRAFLRTQDMQVFLTVFDPELVSLAKEVLYEEEGKEGCV